MSKKLSCFLEETQFEHFKHFHAQLALLCKNQTNLIMSIYKPVSTTLMIGLQRSLTPYIQHFILLMNQWFLFLVFPFYYLSILFAICNPLHFVIDFLMTSVRP